MRDQVLKTTLTRVRRRSMTRTVLNAVSLGGAVFALVLTMATLLWSVPDSSARWAAILSAAVAAVAMVVRQPRVSLVAAARAVERVVPLDNLIVTAAEIEERPRPVPAAMLEEIARQAAERARNVDAAAVVPLVQPVLVAIVVGLGCVMLGTTTERVTDTVRGVGATGSFENEAGSFEMRVTPPAYARRPIETHRDPVQVSVLAGSRIEIPAIKRDWVATRSEAIAVRLHEKAETRFLSVVVVPDLAPSVRIVEPGRDTAFAKPEGRVAIGVQGADDLGLSQMSLQFTIASGGGENVSFTEGEVPIRIERRNQRDWRGTAELTLNGLGLEEGDIVVYRATVRDTNPAAAAIQSDQFVIEIGKTAEIADAGFALPTDERKYAISQQMVIYRTEQLLQRRRQGSGETGSEWLNESRGLAMDQRMVRAEVVFLGGGEVEDEVEEAAHSNELAEGRLQNTGRAEMLRAINAMSRAEVHLNDGRPQDALPLEREALVHLERALDRRRYFLRTLPDRSRIDTTRRFTGERRDARSWLRDRPAGAVTPSLEAPQSVMRSLASRGKIDAALAARLAAIDPDSAELRQAAVRLAAATTEGDREGAVRNAMMALTNHVLRTTASTAPAGIRLSPLAGRLADESRRQ